MNLHNSDGAGSWSGSLVMELGAFLSNQVYLLVKSVRLHINQDVAELIFCVNVRASHVAVHRDLVLAVPGVASGRGSGFGPLLEPTIIRFFTIFNDNVAIGEGVALCCVGLLRKHLDILVVALARADSVACSRWVDYTSSRGPASFSEAPFSNTSAL